MSGAEERKMRWPDHPIKIDGESLSSWLRRVGYAYGLSVKDLLKLGLGMEGIQQKKLDVKPPEELVAALSNRTGVEQGSLHRGTLAGMLPFIFDDSENDDGVGQYGIKPAPLLKVGLSEGIPWFRKQQGLQVTACRLCFEDYPNAAVMLQWRLAILQSCPTHGLMLEEAQVNSACVRWVNKSAEEAPAVLRTFDRRTWTAVADGRVMMPGGLTDTAEWFDMLRIIHGQLRNPMWRYGKGFEYQLIVCDYSPKILFQKRTQAEPGRRWAIVLATAMDLMEKGHMELQGPGNIMLSKEILRDQDHGGKQKAMVREEVKRWRK